jgi:chromosome condensin MukBEF ATPase and DNA-binding subunit MukB
MHARVMANLLLPGLMLTACSFINSVTPEEKEQKAFEEYRETIKEVVPESDRQVEILSLAQKYQADFNKLRATVEAQRNGLRNLNADYDATREQFQAFIDKYDTEIGAARKEATGSRMAFVRATTAEEWAVLKKADAKALKNMVTTTQRI